MAIRMTTRTDANQATVFVEGRLSAAAARDLREECQSIDMRIEILIGAMSAAAIAVNPAVHGCPLSATVPI